LPNRRGAMSSAAGKRHHGVGNPGWRVRPHFSYGPLTGTLTVMQIRFHCPTDGCVAIIEYEPLEECGATIECPRCHVKQPMTVTPAMRTEQTVDRCAVCGSRELFLRKDFPQRVGLAIVLVFGAAAIYFFRTSVFAAFAVLAAAAVLDLIIYALIGKVTTCYACRAEFRRCALNPAHEGFDLATSEKY